MRRRFASVLCPTLVAFALGGCGDDDLTVGQNDSAPPEGVSEDSSESDPSESGSESESGTETTGEDPWEPTEPFERQVHVTLDGDSIEGAVVAQGGNPARWTTNAEGLATITVDPSIPGMTMSVTAAHPDARIRGTSVFEEPELIELELESFVLGDNLEYVFKDPGSPTDFGNTGKCAHCHRTINEEWYGSPHRQSASNPVVQDVYAGAATAFATQSVCETAGGEWWSGLDPATGEAASRCYLGKGALPDLNDNCGDSGSCDGVATEFGDCADCHAPSINGEVGGRDLLEAGGLDGDPSAAGDRAYEYGVHCDLPVRSRRCRAPLAPGCR
jgi:hypothetical protein